MKDYTYVDFENNNHLEVFKKLNLNIDRTVKYMLFDVITGEIKAYVDYNKKLTCLNNEFNNVDEIISYKSILDIDENIITHYKCERSN